MAQTFRELEEVATLLVDHANKYKMDHRIQYKAKISLAEAQELIQESMLKTLMAYKAYICREMIKEIESTMTDVVVEMREWKRIKELQEKLSELPKINDEVRFANDYMIEGYFYQILSNQTKNKLSKRANERKYINQDYDVLQLLDAPKPQSMDRSLIYNELICRYNDYLNNESLNAEYLDRKKQVLILLQDGCTDVVVSRAIKRPVREVRLIKKEIAEDINNIFGCLEEDAA